MSEDRYWKILWSNVKLSARHGAGGARISKLRGYGERDLEITLDDIKKMWHNQNGKCYWLNISMSLPDLEIKDSPFAPSVERLDNALGYVHGNVVLASRFANRGRGAYSGEDFGERLNLLLEERNGTGFRTQSSLSHEGSVSRRMPILRSSQHGL